LKKIEEKIQELKNQDQENKSQAWKLIREKKNLTKKVKLKLNKFSPISIFIYLKNRKKVYQKKIASKTRVLII
jgi:hypothetical protein